MTADEWVAILASAKRAAAEDERTAGSTWPSYCRGWADCLAYVAERALECHAQPQPAPAHVQVDPQGNDRLGAEFKAHDAHPPATAADGAGELPPLPAAEYRVSPDSRQPSLYDEDAMRAYARAAIAALRQPVAARASDEDVRAAQDAFESLPVPGSTKSARVRAAIECDRARRR